MKRNPVWGNEMLSVDPAIITTSREPAGYTGVSF